MKSFSKILNEQKSNKQLNVKNTKTTIDTNQPLDNKYLDAWYDNDTLDHKAYITLQRVTHGQKYPSETEDKFIAASDFDKKFKIKNANDIGVHDIVIINSKSKGDLSGEFMVMNMVFKHPGLRATRFKTVPLYILE